MAIFKRAVILCVLQGMALCSAVVLMSPLQDTPPPPLGNNHIVIPDPVAINALVIGKQITGFRAANEMLSNLDNIQNNTQNIASDIGESITNALSDIEHALQDAADKWNQTVQEIVTLIRAVNTAEDDCILTGTPLDNVTLGFKNDLIQCFGESVNTTISLGQRADDIQYQGKQLMRDTKRTIDLCSQSNLPSDILCWTENLPNLIMRTIQLEADAFLTNIEAININNIITIQTDLCAAIAFSTRSKQAETIIKTSVKCFNDHRPKG